jgi:PIN domain-containing protein
VDLLLPPVTSKVAGSSPVHPAIFSQLTSSCSSSGAGTLVFLIDRDLGTTFPETLKRAGFAVERHRDHFPGDCPDEEWLASVAFRPYLGDA